MKLDDREYGKQKGANAYDPFSTAEMTIDCLDQFFNLDAVG